MRKHFLLFLLMSFLLPLGAWADEAVTLLTATPQSREYNGNAPEITVKATAEGPELEGTWAASDGGVLTEGVPSKNAGVYTWTETGAENPRTATFTILKKQVVYFLTGKTYAVGDTPDVTNHYSLAVGDFVEGEELSDYASFAFPSTGNDKLDLDDNNRFTTIKTYNLTALRVVEENVPQNYDFRFTSTATIVVTAKNIAAFLSDDVDDQVYTGSQITFAADELPAIYASAEDQGAEIALDPANYDVSYGENINVATGGTIIYTGKGNYEGQCVIPFDITKRALASVAVADIEDQTYAYGVAITPALTVTGSDEDGNEYALALETDYTVNYNGTNINVSENGAVGTLAGVAEGSNFTFPEEEDDIEDAEFMIVPKNLGDDDIAIAAIEPKTYTGAVIEPVSNVTWTIGETPNNLAYDGEGAVVAFEYANNDVVGKATITVVPKEGANNYTGSKSRTFDIIPTDLATANVTIAFKQVNPENEEELIDKTFSYVGRDIKPGTTEGDGVLYVTDGENVLEEGVDYEIVSYGTNVTIGETNYTGDNKNASTETKKGTVTIKGIGNYGKINALGDPITKSAIFAINKATVTYTAADVTTTFGVAPAFSATNDVVEGESIGGKLTYSVEVNNGSLEIPEWENYGGALTALAVDKQYRYKAAWEMKSDAVAPNPLPAGKTADDYDTQAQIDARANYNTAAIVYEYGKITVNNAKWIIVPDDKEKKYGVADDALTFTYKVYNGTVAAANLVAEPAFDRNPQIGRPANIGTTPNNGEIVIGGGYKIAVLNQTGEGAVAKAGYTIECQTGTLTIVPFEITLTANDQIINFGEEPNTETTDDSWIKDEENGDEDGNGDLLTVTYAPVMLGNGTLINRADLGLKLTWDKDGAIGTHEGALVPSITNTNFKVTSVTNGDVEVLSEDVLALWDGDKDVLDKINAYDGIEDVDVWIKIDQRDRELGGKERTWAAEQWNTMTLPFDITVAELSQILGYAIVNVVNADGYTESESGAPVYKFNLTMKGGYDKDYLPANKPFAIKTTDALNEWIEENADEDGYLYFGERTIVAPTAEDFAGVNAGGGSTFKPAYAKRTIDKGDNGYIWFLLGNYAKWAYIKSNSGAEWNIVPFEGFIDQSANTAPAAEAPIFIMEELDGTTTAITGVEADDVDVKQNAEGWYTLQGVKLDSAPTEKGIYIKDGKKVAVQ